MNSFLRTLVCATFLCGLSATAAADFLVVEQRAAAELASIDQPGVVDAHWVQLDLPELSRRSEVLEFEMPDGTRHRVQLSNFEQRDAGDLVWRGWLDGGEDRRATLTLKNGYVAGRIETPGAVFEIQPARDGKQLLLELDLDAFPACAGGVEPSAERSETVPAASQRGPGTTNMDVMAVYTPQARDAAGGVAQIEAQIQAAVDASNTAFIDSNMIGRFTLVHTALANHNDSGNSSTDLNWVASDPTVASLRNTYGADMVGLITSNGGGGCGRGFVMRNPGPGFESSAFQVTDRDCAVGNLTYAHEHGHNMGFEHDPANGTSTSNASYPYAFAHFVNGSYRTVMSYSNQCTSGCTRVAHFSNPDITHNGVATGIANQRDNARAGDNTAPIVAAFRGSVVTGPVVSQPDPADGATVAPGASGQLLRVLAPGATGGTIHYDDDPAISWSDTATVNGDFLEITVPYTSCATDGRMCDDGTNYWYVEATNASGTTRFPASGSLSFTVADLPTVSNPNPADGATVPLGAGGQLLRVSAPGATSGTIHYDDDSVISWSDPATVNGDFLEIVVPYTDCNVDGRMGDCGTNYWYVEATNAAGTVRYPASGSLSFTIETLNPPTVSDPSPADGETVAPGSTGNLLRVLAPDATSGTFYYGDDTSTASSAAATVNGDYLEVVAPYPDITDSGTNYWYVEATNADGTTRFPASGTLSFTVDSTVPPTVSDPSPADGAVVPPGTTGHLLRVFAPEATGGTFFYDDDTSTNFGRVASKNGDYLEVEAPYPDVTDSGTNYWYVVAGNSAGNTRYPASGLLSFTVSGGTACVGVNEGNSVVSGTETMTACSELSVGPSVILESTSDVIFESGDYIRFEPEFSVEQGAQLLIRTCGQNLCDAGPNPLDAQCHSCVEQVCTGDAFCCNNQWDQSCADQVETVCGLSCN